MRYWPAPAVGVGSESSSDTSRNELMVALSRRTSATRSGRKPGHAGAAAAAPSSFARSSRKLPFQPSLNAGIRSARSSSVRDLSGR